MSHPHGAYLGSVRCIETLRARCVVDKIGKCWHYRSARGRPMPKGARHSVHLHGVGAISVTRCAWMLHTGAEEVPAGFRVYRVCESYDCVNPDHLRCWTPAAFGQWQVKTGCARTVARSIANIVEGKRRSKVPYDLRRWIAEADLPIKEVAASVGISRSYAVAIRQRYARDHGVRS